MKIRLVPPASFGTGKEAYQLPSLLIVGFGTINYMCLSPEYQQRGSDKVARGWEDGPASVCGVNNGRGKQFLTQDVWPEPLGIQSREHVIFPNLGAKVLNTGQVEQVEWILVYEQCQIVSRTNRNPP